MHHLVCGFITGVFQCQVNHGVLESPAHVELKGEVIHPLQDKTEKTTCIIHSIHVKCVTIQMVDPPTPPPSNSRRTNLPFYQEETSAGPGWYRGTTILKCVYVLNKHKG